MVSIKDIVTEEFIKDNPLPANFAYDKLINDRDGVELIVKRLPRLKHGWVVWTGTVKEGAGN